MRTMYTLVIAAVLLAGSVSAAHQDTVQRLKDLYASAAYEDALGVIDRLGSADPQPDVAQFRVFCLVALGRTAEAEQAAEPLVKANPVFRPEASDASPRILDVFTKVRRRVAPAIIKSLYTEGKAALDRKDRAAAIDYFGQLVRAADDPDLAGDTVVAELRLLGSGFLDLSRAVPTAPEPAPPLVTPPPAPSPAAPRVATPPIPVREVMPPWMPDDASLHLQFRGAIRVHITAEGKVDSSEIVTPVHPRYDRLLLQASRDWLYRPAESNGAPVPSERVVQVVLKPR